MTDAAPIKVNVIRQDAPLWQQKNAGTTTPSARAIRRAAAKIARGKRK